MYCKNCGKEIDPAADVCTACGFRKGTGNKYCQNCGEPVAEGQAMCIKCGHMLEEKPAVKPGEQKSKMAAGLLGIFLGGLGIHNFYLGNTGKGVAQLLLSCTGISSI